MTRRDKVFGDELPAERGSPSQTTVGVDFEYGDLKEAIVGIPSGVYPVIEKADWLYELAKVLPKEEFEKAKERSGKNNKELPKYDQMERENQELIVLLEHHGVKVWRPEEVTEEQFVANFGAENLTICGFTQQYTRDPIVVIGDNVIELAASTPIRRADILGFKRLFKERLTVSNNKWYAMPVVDWSAMMNPKKGHDKTMIPVLEGGDIFVLGKKIIVGTSLNNTVGSSELGYQWLRNMLEPQGYDVEQVPLSEEFLPLIACCPRRGRA